MPAIRAGACGLALAALALVAPGVARAAPANDNLGSATVVGSLPFHETVNVTDATLEPFEPSFCGGPSKSVWYRFTAPSSGQVRAETTDSPFFDPHLAVYRENGPGFAGLSVMSCASPVWNGQRSVLFSVDAGATYVVQTGSTFSFGGPVVLSIEEIVPPPNDDFANAIPAAGLPFSSSVDTTAATRESGEPLIDCPFVLSDRSAWYSFTPTEDVTVTASMSGPFAWGIAAYTGPSVDSLTRVGCRFSSLLAVPVHAGTTYWFQVAQSSGGSRATFQLAVAPPPTAQFATFIPDPSVFDSIFFQDQSGDPAGLGIESWSWDFGDGAKASQQFPQHRYAKDGDYVVSLEVRTVDGRTGKTSRTIHVETHDVAVARLQVPQSGAAGQTRSIAVGIANVRYDDTVEVELLKSGPNGMWVRVGVLTQLVQARPNRTTPFEFNYTFTPDDAQNGKVTFRVVSRIVGHRDAAPLDNEAVALPTKVR